MLQYNQTYHSEIEESALKSADIVVKMLNAMFKPNSVIDVGCGRGTWLRAWQKAGVTDIFGIDGGNQDMSKLLIPQHSFQEYDLNKGYVSNRKFDLVTCLEVVEHLRIKSADCIVQTLTNLSDVIVFSAAIPNQGGFKHYNEQWPYFWAKRFEKHGFVMVDGLRSKLLNEEEVSWWYRQNLFLVLRKEVYEKSFSYLPVYNPEFYLMHKFVYKASTSLTYKLYFWIQQFLYNHFHSFYHRILPFFKKLFKS